MNYKPFDLEAAKRGEPLITREGARAWFIGVTPEEAGSDQPVVAWVDGEAEPCTFYENGHYVYENDPDYYDLFMAPTQHQVWAVTFLDEDNCPEIICCHNALHADKVADKLREQGKNVVDVRTIEWEG